MAHKAERPLPIHLIYLAEACRIRVWLRELAIDHVHAHFGTNSAEVAMLTRALGGPTWSFTVHGPEEFDKAPLIGLAEKIRSCTFVVAISSFGRSQLYRLVEPSHWAKIYIVHCGVDEAFVHVETAFSDSPRMVCVGRLCEQKGQFLLIEAAHRLVKEGVDLQLTLVGDGELRDQIESLIGRFRLKDRISITGWISGEQVRNEIINARALVLPSFAEGLPVYHGSNGASAACYHDLHCGHTRTRNERGKWLGRPAGDIDALSDAMRACLSSTPHVLMSMGENGRQRVLKRHDVNREAEKLAALFKNYAKAEK